MSWTPVVERLLRDFDQGPWRWAVMKNHEQLPVVVGDVDLCLAREQWNPFTRAIGSSLDSMGTFKIVSCDHFIGVRLIFIVPDSGPVPERRALELDLADGVWWKGTLLCPANRVIQDFVTYQEGEAAAPHTSAGFQAALKLTISAIRRQGTLDRDEIERTQVMFKARDEPEIFVRAMEVFHGPAGVRAAQAILCGGWTAATGRRLIVGRMKRSPLPYRRAVCFLRRKTGRHWRGLPRYVPDSTAQWLARISRGHELM